MKQLLYYTLDSKFVSDQKAVGGDGTNVVSVVNGVAWTKDERNAYYRYAKPNSENVTSCTLTIHYKDINGNSIAPDDVFTADIYVGKKAIKTIKAKKISGYTVITDDAKTFIIDGNIEYTFIYNDAPREETPLLFYILSSGTIVWKTDRFSYRKTIQYSKNGSGWVDITSDTSYSESIDVAAGDIVKFRGNNNSYCTSTNSINFFASSTPVLRFNAYGNIMSLINSTDFKNLKTFASSSAFTGLFSGCTSLVEADKLLLPATALSNYDCQSCYYGMFAGCTNLTQAPELPATTLVDYCYCRMFNGCTSLAQAPELPATNLDYNCYMYMFAGCTNLTQAPELPAETLRNECYASMFEGCTSLKIAPELPATTLATKCYGSMFYGCTSLATAPSVLPAATMATSACTNMFQGCTSLTKAPELPATALTKNCYQSMFQDCTSLITAPELPATTLADYCYDRMFYGCTSLTKAPSLPARTLTTCCYASMFEGCTSLKIAPVLPAETLNSYCYDGMFQGCTSLEQASELPATSLAVNCYYSMFQGCTNLTTAPELPATTLKYQCYGSMFSGCTSLNYIKCLATDISAGRCTTGWVNGVAASGTFVKNASMSWGIGVDGIPSGWTVEDATS